MNNYQINKAKARQRAIDYQLSISGDGFVLHKLTYKTSYYSLAKISEYFYKLGKRYGLLKEFRENGIC